MAAAEFQCPFCTKIFLTRNEAKSHSLSVHRGRPFVEKFEARYGPDPQQEIINEIEVQKKISETEKQNRKLEHEKFDIKIEQVHRTVSSKDEMLSSVVIVKDPLQFCIDVILAEARMEDRLVKQLLYAMLSGYTNNPLNLAINAPSGEGKSHTISKVSEKFPEEDVIVYAGMSDKAMFHRQGVLVVKNVNGQYEDVESQLEELEKNIEDKKLESSTTKDKTLKSMLWTEIKQLNRQRRDILKEAKKLIDLRHKILIFMDTPSPRLFEAIMPLLSHDKFEVEYEFVDTHAGIKTKSNVLRGWPAVIFAQAIDYSHYQRFPEIQRRFIVTNPKMSVEKYREAVELTSQKYGLPDFVYQAMIVSDYKKDQVREIIKAFKDNILSVAGNSLPGKHNVFVPFNEVVCRALPSERAFDMTTAHRFFAFLSLLPIINYERRPRIAYRKTGDPILQNIPLATFEDLRESMFLMEYSNGVRPYVLEWFNEVFLRTYQAKTEPDWKNGRELKDGGHEKLVEKRIALTTEQLADATYSEQKKKLSTKQVLDTYINPLLNQGYVDKADSELDKRANIYYPVLSIAQKKLFENSGSNNYLQSPKIPVIVSSDYPDNDYITSKIEAVTKYSTDNRVFALQDASGEEKNSKEIASQFYNSPEDYFTFANEGVAAEYRNKPKLSSVCPTEEEKYSKSTKSNTFEAEKEGQP